MKFNINELIEYLSQGDLNVPEKDKKLIREFCLSEFGIKLSIDSPMIKSNHMSFKYEGSDVVFYSDRNYESFFKNVVKYNN